jgi:non-lysosomal glucosylceramidase
MPYWSEVWTGLAHIYAIRLAQAGHSSLAEEVVTAVRDRFDGFRRNPFDETEADITMHGPWPAGASSSALLGSITTAEAG